VADGHLKYLARQQQGAVTREVDLVALVVRPDLPWKLAVRWVECSVVGLQNHVPGKKHGKCAQFDNHYF